MGNKILFKKGECTMTKSKFVKRAVSLLSCALLSVGFVACGGAGDNGDGGAGQVGAYGWYVERSGYTFCGYYNDADFTDPVTEEVTEETAKNYYPKYQIDKVQQMECAPTVFDNVIYAPDFITALTLYRLQSSAIYDMYTVRQQTNYEQYGIQYTQFQVIANDVDAGLYEMTDTSQTVPYDYRNICIPHYMQYGSRIYNSETGAYEEKLYTRNNVWNAYISSDLEETATSIDDVIYDGWVYDIIDNSFAVVYGLADEEYTGQTNLTNATSLSIPSSIKGYPVKEVSIINRNEEIYMPDTIGTFTIPSSVENVVLYRTPKTGFTIENLVVQEGVKTVRMDAYMAKNISLPKSAYYVDLNAMYNRQTKNNCYTTQSVTVANGGHYYTKDGCLYSKEGDLVFQFAKRDKLDLRIDTTAKRVLPMSITGGNKNIYIPEHMEYFDVFAFLFGARDWFSSGSTAQTMGIQPMLLIDSPKVMKRLLQDSMHDAGYSFFMPMLFADDIGEQPILIELWPELQAGFVASGETPPDGLTMEEFLSGIESYFMNSIKGSITYEEDGQTVTVEIIDGYRIFTAFENHICVEVDNAVYRACKYDAMTGSYHVVVYSYVNLPENTDLSTLEPSIVDPVFPNYNTQDEDVK